MSILDRIFGRVHQSDQEDQTTQQEEQTTQGSLLTRTELPELRLIATLRNPPQTPTSDLAHNSTLCVRDWLNQNGVQTKRVSGSGDEHHMLVVTYIQATDEQVEMIRKTRPHVISEYSLRRRYHSIIE